MSTLTETTRPPNSDAGAGKNPMPLQTIEDRIAQEERDQEEYKRWFARQIELHLQDPEMVAWLDTPVRHRSPRPHLSTRMIWHLEMRRSDDCLVRFRELVGALVAEKPTEVLDDGELNPKPAQKSSRRRKPVSNDERGASKQPV